MESTLKEIDLNDFPVSFRVIGYGESFQDLIQEINKIGYEGLQTDVLKEGDVILPTDEDKMIIIFCATACEGLENFLKTFHQAGVLTIVISTDQLEIPADTYDSLMVANRSEMISAVKTLMNPVFYQGRINYDFNDLAYTLRDSSLFITLTATGSGTDRMKKAVASLSDMFPTDEGFENMSLIIRANERAIEPPLCMDEMSLITDYIGHLPESVNVIWGMYNDDKLDSKTIGLSVIASGKNIKL